MAVILRSLEVLCFVRFRDMHGHVMLCFLFGQTKTKTCFGSFFFEAQSYWDEWPPTLRRVAQRSQVKKGSTRYHHIIASS